MIYPMYVMVLLSFVLALVMFRGRSKAVKSKQIPFKYFRAMTGDVTMPEYASIPTRHFSNLFEVPVLFYAVGLASMILQQAGPVMIGLAWAFVFLRLVQAIIHLTYNNIFHRMTAYALGFGVVLTMWTLLVFLSI
jgi:hypothetical protein